MKTILITGASGFIGCHLLKYLLNNGKYKIRIFIRPQSDLSRLQGLLDKVEVFKADFYSEKDINESLKGVDIFIHLASVLGRAKKEDYKNFNINTTERFFFYSLRQKVEKIIFLSSFEVMSGNDKLNYFRETDAPNPLTSYGKSKYEVEKIANQYIQNQGSNITILRVPAVYGPEDNFDRGFIRVIDLIVRNKFIPFWNMKNYMGLIYVENLVHAIAACMKNKKSNKNLYFVADKELLMVKETYNLMVQLGSARKSIIRVPKFFVVIIEWIIESCARIFNFLPSFPEKFVRNITSNYACSTEKIEKDLNWYPPYTLYAGMRKTIEWYRKEKKWKK